jgi:hypothetical protein
MDSLTLTADVLTSAECLMNPPLSSIIGSPRRLERLGLRRTGIVYLGKRMEWLGRI